MSIIVPMMTMMMIAQNNRMIAENNRRRREEEVRRQRRIREKQLNEEEREKLINHYKNSPVVNTGESWQQDRCTKAFSLQPSVIEFIKLIEKERPYIILEKQKEFDSQLISVGYEYENIRKKIEENIASLKAMGISTKGKQYKLTRLSPINSYIPNVEETNETLGYTFVTPTGQSVNINSEIISDEKYYHRKYAQSHPEEVAKEYAKVSKKMQRYLSFGKYLRFLLKTDRYLDFKHHYKKVNCDYINCESKRKEKEGFESLNKEQLLIIKEYLSHINELIELSEKIQELFKQKRYLENSNNQEVCNLTIQRIIGNQEYYELVSKIQTYIDNIHNNDEETMKEAFELVKGEYPINIEQRFIYELLIKNIQDYRPEIQKELKLR